MPEVAHGITMSQFYLMLAHYEPKLDFYTAKEAWPKFVQWRHYGQ